MTSLPQIDSTKWQYNSDDKIYWQTGISYCENPADENYETLGIFIPAAYMNAKDNGDGTFTCEINNQAAVQGYTADSAPIVIPVNTPGYSAMEAPTDYVTDSVSYTSAGFIYVAAGCRGRDAGAPAGVTDLKAAIRYIRYNDGVIPGDVDRVFSFGMSGGGAQSDTSLTTEVNLALALKNYGADVDFATIWGEGHTMAESTGDSVTNFIEWVNKCLK